MKTGWTSGVTPSQSAIYMKYGSRYTGDSDSDVETELDLGYKLQLRIEES